jgi:hypothetical protein
MNDEVHRIVSCSEMEVIGLGATFFWDGITVDWKGSGIHNYGLGTWHLACIASHPSSWDLACIF